MEPFQCSNSNQGTQFIHAIITAEIEKVKSLIANGASVNQRSPDVLLQISTPLQVAINHSNLELVNLLLSEGADPNMAYSPFGDLFPTYLNEPIFHAFALPSNSYEIVMALVRAGAKLDVKDYSGSYPLHLAIVLGWSDLVDENIAHRISLEQTDGCGRTPCILAAQMGRVNTLRKLLDNNAQINKQDPNGRTALMYAVESYLGFHDSTVYENCVNLLLERNADVNIVDFKKQNAILGQFCNWNKPGKDNVLLALIDAGCSISTKSGAGYSALHMAVSCMSTDLIHSLIALGADVNQLTGEKRSALCELARHMPYDEKMYTNVAKCLLGYGADPDLTHPLVVAAVYNRLGLVETILDCGGYINDVHPNYGTVLFNAGVVGNREMAKLALLFKAEINISNIPDKDYPEHPENPDKSALMLLFGAGEKYPFLESSDECVPTPILNAQEDMSLKNQCRSMIRDTIIMTNNHENLFEATKKLQIPTLLKDYILYWVSLDDDKEQFDTKLDENEQYARDDTKCCIIPMVLRYMFH